MATQIYNLNDLQAIRDNLSGDYELANNIDASGSAILNPVSFLGDWQQSYPYTEGAHRVGFDGTRIVCKRDISRYGAGAVITSRNAFGIRAPSTGKIGTFRISLHSTSGDLSTGGATLALYTADSDYIPRHLIASYYFPDLTYHEWYDIFAPWDYQIDDVWLTLPEEYKFDVVSGTDYALLFEPDDPSDLSASSSYRERRVPTYTPTASTTNLKAYHYWHDTNLEWVTTTTRPNMVLYTHAYYECKESHTSGRYWDPDLWTSIGIEAPPVIAYKGFEPIGDAWKSVTTYRYPTSDIDISAGVNAAGVNDPTPDGLYWNKVDDIRGYLDLFSRFVWTDYGGPFPGGNTYHAVFGFSSVDIPLDAYNIRVRITMHHQAQYGGDPLIAGLLRIGFGDYYTAYSTPSFNWETKTYSFTTNPATGADWAPIEIVGLRGFGFSASAYEILYFTSIYMYVTYSVPERPFTGTLDGKNHEITALEIVRPTEYYVGVFKLTEGATIENCSTDVAVSGFAGVGCLVGLSYDSTFSGCQTSGTATGDRGIGGLIGYADEDGGGGTIVNRCNSSAVVTGTVPGDLPNDIGGLIGNTWEGSITECYATGSVTGGDYLTGGLVGSNNYCDINRSYATGNVGGGYWVGGLCGENYGACVIADCYATGSVTGSNSRIGGLVGYNYSNGQVLRSYSIGDVIGGSNVGGLCGFNAATITDCFWDTQTSGMATSDGGTGKTTAEMKEILTFPTWNMGQAAAQRNDGYPFLSWEIGESTFIWLIYGDGSYSFTFPDLMDYKGRHPKNARVVAYRADTHGFVEEQYTDHHGSATFTALPVGVDVVFHAIWGGASQDEWFFLRVNAIEDGGTGSGTAEGARDNLGISNMGLIWELVFGD